MPTPLDDKALDQIFRKARTHNERGFEDETTSVVDLGGFKSSACLCKHGYERNRSAAACVQT